MDELPLGASQGDQPVDDQQDMHGVTGVPTREGTVGTRDGARRAASLLTDTLAQSGTLVLGYLLSFVLDPILIARLGLFGFWGVVAGIRRGTMTPARS
jgi:hypothetical protein